MMMHEKKCKTFLSKTDRKSTYKIEHHIHRTHQNGVNAQFTPIHDTQLL